MYAVAVGGVSWVHLRWRTHCSVRFGGCQSCRDRLESTDQYVAAMKAAGKIRQSGEGV